jgi:hypothetical protein
VSRMTVVTDQLVSPLSQLMDIKDTHHLDPVNKKPRYIANGLRFEIFME